MKHLLIILIKGYQLFLSPLLGSNCRYQPTCSHYAAEAIAILDDVLTRMQVHQLKKTLQLRALHSW